jgi:hypothetical protein
VNEPGTYRSHLFTLRLWIEPGDHHHVAIRFRVQDLQSGEVRYFSSWPALVAYLDAVFKGGEDDALHRHWPDDNA